MDDAKHILLIDDDGEARAASRLVVASRCAGARLVEVATAVELVDALVLGGFELVVVEPSVPWADADDLVGCLARHLPAARLIIFTRDPDPFADELAGRPGVSAWVHKDGFSCVTALAQAVQVALDTAESPNGRVFPDLDELESSPGLMRVTRPSQRVSPPPDDPPVVPSVMEHTAAQTGGHTPIQEPPRTDLSHRVIRSNPVAEDTPVPEARIGAVVGMPEDRHPGLRLSTPAAQQAPEPMLETPLSAEGLEALGTLHDMQEPLRTVINYLTVLRERHGDDMDGVAPSLMEKAEGAARRMLDGLQQGLPTSKTDTPRAIPSRPGKATGRWRVTEDADFPALELGPSTESIALHNDEDVETIDVQRASIDDGVTRPVAPLPEDLGDSALDLSDPEVAMRATLENLESTISRHGALITWDPLPESLPLSELQLTQLFQNLLSNAIKFRGRKAPRIHLGVTDVPNGYEISIADNGGGIPREAQKRVFRMFERAHGSAYPGTGIGLAICKQIVEGAGGNIWLESVPGVGTTVRFRVPLVWEKLTVGAVAPTLSG